MILSLSQKCLSDGNFIYKGSYSGWYCVADEAFLSDSQVKEVSTEGNCHKVSIESGHPVEWTTEENFIFRLSSFKNDLLYWLQKGWCIMITRAYNFKISNKKIRRYQR